MSTRDSLFRSLEDVRRELRGINPKLAVYEKLKKEEADILAKLGSDPEDFAAPPLRLQKADHSMKHCRVPDCKNLGRKKGGGKRANFCKTHRYAHKRPTV